MAKMKLALVQFQSVLGDVEASMARALPMIDEAAPQAPTWWYFRAVYHRLSFGYGPDRA